MRTKEKEVRGISSAELWIRDASFRRNCAKFLDIRNREISLPYRELVAAYLEIPEEGTGRTAHPELARITEDLEGCLVLYDREYRRLRIHSVGTAIRAGAMFKELAVHAPYLFFEYMPWMDQGDSEEFSGIREMVSVMRAISGDA